MAGFTKFLAVFVLFSIVYGPQSVVAVEVISKQDIEAAIARGLTLVKDAATHWQENTSCFACHHQTLPMLAVLEAASAGIESIDQTWLQSQRETTHQYFADRLNLMRSGQHVPGGAGTTGYAFWALSLADQQPDEVTAAMVEYAIDIQGVKRRSDRDDNEELKINDGRWIASCRRPPMQASMIGDTVLVLSGISKFATPEQQKSVDEATRKANVWLDQVPLRNHQDRLWRLWGLAQIEPNSPKLTDVRQSLEASQREDGGWSEDEQRSSDAYSTGQALFILCKSGVPSDATYILRARDYLLRTQLPDGSWLVESHVANKVQPYFENGDPHGEHQFISTAGTAWAVAGLAQIVNQR